MKRRHVPWSAWLVAGLFAQAPAAMAASDPLWWRAPATPEVTWRGMLATEGAGVGIGPQIGLYPAFGAVGLLAAIFTHAAISHGAQSAARKKEQDEADRVLAPYADALRAWPARALWDATLAALPAESAPQLWEAQDPPKQGAWMETAAVFTLAQDEGVLVLDVAVKHVAAPAATPTENVVRVVSSPHEAADARAHWSADGAARLKSTAAGMLAHALQIALQPLVGGEAAPPMRTHRYLQGSIERTERAQQIGGDCARAVLRNLRGWLMSVPVRPAEGSPCEKRTPF